MKDATQWMNGPRPHHVSGSARYFRVKALIGERVRPTSRDRLPVCPSWSRCGARGRLAGLGTEVTYAKFRHGSDIER